MSTPTRRRDAIANREALLDAAARLLRQDPHVSLDTIATAAGLTRRSVYGHFSSRGDLLAGLLDRGSRQIAEALDGVRDDDPAVHLALLGVAVWRAIADVKLIVRLLVSEPLETRVDEAIAPVRASLREVIERGAADGAFRSDIVPTTLSRVIEQAALGVLDIAVERRMPDEEAQRMLSATTLGIAGMSWRDAQLAFDRARAGVRA